MSLLFNITMRDKNLSQHFRFSFWIPVTPQLQTNRRSSTPKSLSLPIPRDETDLIVKLLSFRDFVVGASLSILCGTYFAVDGYSRLRAGNGYTEHEASCRILLKPR